MFPLIKIGKILFSSYLVVYLVGNITGFIVLRNWFRKFHIGIFDTLFAFSVVLLTIIFSIFINKKTILGYKIGNMSYGIMFSGIISIWVLSKLYKFSFLKSIDFFTPWVVFIYAFARIGCYMAGCCRGVPTNVSWGVVFPYSQNITPVHPVQLYDSYLNFLLFLLEYKGKKKFEGELFLLFLIGNSIIRFFVEYFRWGVSTYVLLNFITLPQIVSIAIIIVSIIVIIKKVTNNET